MVYKAEFKGWNELKPIDMLVAYRKAKADCFFENTIFPTAIKFAAYEEHLLKNLEDLLSQLQANKGFSEQKKLLGKCRLVPKKLSVKQESHSNVHFSNPEIAFDYLLKENSTVTPEFRVVGDFPVETHIISALWINMIGHKFDAHLNDKHCYASRLKRIRSTNEVCENNKQKKYHIDSIGSFTPYFYPYKRFRQDGIKAIREELEKEEDIVAISLDLQNYFHMLDPKALDSYSLRKCLGLTGDNKLSLNEREFTRELSIFLSVWSEEASEFLCASKSGLKERVPGGLAIGLTASKIIANVMLHRWDQLISEELTPIYYGRYVDDMFIVLRDTKKIFGINDFMNLLAKRIGKKALFLDDETGAWQIQQGKAIQRESEINFHLRKQKIFILSGQTGLDLLNNIEEEIRELSSERRLMPSPSDMAHSAAVRVLSAVSGIGEKSDTLRRSDGLTIQRLGLALHLRHVETLARDLPDCEWKKERLEFYDFAHNHILCAANMLNNFSYVPRILGLAVSCGEWKKARCIIESSFKSLDQLFGYLSESNNIVVNGMKIKAESKIKGKILRETNAYFAWVFFDASVSYLPESDDKKFAQYRPLSLLVEKLQSKARGFFEELLRSEDSIEYTLGLSNLLKLSDLSRKPYKELWKGVYSKKKLEGQKSLYPDRTHRIRKGEELSDIFRDASFAEMDDLDDFLVKRSERLDTGELFESSKLPYIFPTRPYTPAEIVELIPDCILQDGKFDAKLWPRYTKALRGSSVKNSISRSNKNSEGLFPKITKIGTQKKQEITIALSNFQTDDLEWREMANDDTKLKFERYKRIAHLVNQAIQLEPKPDYLVFPELSIPIKWIDSMATRLMASEISLIAGTEYRHHSDRKIFSEACLVLSDDRLGFPAWVKIWQPKNIPAVSEEKDLISKFGKTWSLPPDTMSGGTNETDVKQVYDHNGFHFSLMICSELQNSKSRVKLQGVVDALFVLAWNQDLDTFSSLLESASLDIHAYTILVNNRKYGDSRVRSPAKKLFKRDLARLRGGNNDFIVSVTLDVDKLREFQSRHKRWPEPTDEFKPVPEGYKILPSRKILPSIG